MKILIIEDNKDYSKQLADKLKEKGYDPNSVNSLSSAEKELEQTIYNLIFINWSLAKEKTVEFIHEVKKSGKKSSIIVLSDTNDKYDEITALNGGADDYFRMPFENGKLHEGDFSVLNARMDARLRFGGTNVISIDDLVIDPDEEKIFYQGKEIELKGKPFEVLTHLAKHRDQIVSKEQLLDAIWEEPELVTPNVIEVAINQIRQKMDKPLGIGTIETVRRRGYRFCFPNCMGEG
jgi:two-component system OmpR family response regulator